MQYFQQLTKYNYTLHDSYIDNFFHMNIIKKYKIMNFKQVLITLMFSISYFLRKTKRQLPMHSFHFHLRESILMLNFQFLIQMHFIRLKFFPLQKWKLDIGFSHIMYNFLNLDSLLKFHIILIYLNEMQEQTNSKQVL